MADTTTLPRLGLALPGAAARSAFYVGFLEVLQEHEVLVSTIAAQSGASLVAACYACGTLDKLKADLFSLKWQTIRPFLVRSRKQGGLYSLERYEEYVRTHYTLGKQFSEVATRLVFTATNLHTGELVPLALGDIASSIRITCSVPGLFAPVRWGNYLLIDGGLLSVIPGTLAREAGADVVVGVDAKATRHIFSPGQIKMREWYTVLREKLKSSPWLAGRQFLSASGFEVYMETVSRLDTAEVTNPSIFKVLGRSLDLASKAASKPAPPEFNCDFVISEGAGKFTDSVVISQMERSYKDGRRSAEASFSQIKDLLNSKSQITNIK